MKLALTIETFFIMTLGSQGSESESNAASSAEAKTASKVVNPNLSATLNADYEALQNDLEQAKELAADFQRQLAGKSNEFAQLKQVFDKTLADLAHLQSGIVELRAERHGLANEAMRSTAFQIKLNKVTGERDRLRIDLEIVRKALAKSAEEMAGAVRDRDAQIAVLVVELVTLKEALIDAQRRAAEINPSRRVSGEIESEAALQVVTSEDGSAEVEEILNIRLS